MFSAVRPQPHLSQVLAHIPYALSAFPARTMRFLPGLLLCLTLGFVDVLPVYGQADSIHVWLLARSMPETIAVQTSSERLRIHLTDGSNKTLTVDDGGSVTVRREDDRVVVEGPGNRALVGAAEFAPGTGNHFAVKARGTTRRYYGRLIVDAHPDRSGLRLINRVAMEDYLASVVASEYPFEEMEGAKAQAVIARTYALHARQNSQEVFDVTDNTASQAYLGLDRETELSQRAVRATRGEILTHDNRPIEAVYSASGGGHTADNENVWNSEPVPYLRGKPDPYDRSSPHQSWQFSVSRSALHDILSTEYGFAVRGIRFDDRTAEGRHRTVTLFGENEREIPANTLRYLITRKFGPRSLKSTLFEVEKTAEQYVFEGRGFGHGVGLSQWGTHARARDGQSYDEILQFYYTNVALETTGGELIAAAQGPSDQRSDEEVPATRSRIERTRTSLADRHGGWVSRKPVSLEEIERRPPRPGW